MHWVDADKLAVYRRAMLYEARKRKLDEEDFAAAFDRLVAAMDDKIDEKVWRAVLRTLCEVVKHGKGKDARGTFR